jgi:hypothetical protein
MVGVLCAFVVMLVVSGVALGAYTHSFISSFGSFGEVTSIAIDQSTGDVYVFDNGTGGGTISKFDPEGKPVDFSSTGTNEITNVGTDPYSPAESEIAVDSDSLSPAYGDIYAAVIEANGRKLVIYSASGEKVGELTKEVENEVPEALGSWKRGPCGVATDPQGNVYVALWAGGPGHVNKYVPSGTHPVNTDYAGSLWGLPTNLPCSIAVDSAGNTFEQNGTVYSASQFNKTGTQASGSAVFSGNEVYTLATDPSTDELYVDTDNTVASFGATGVLQFGPHGEPFGSPKAAFATFGEGAFLGESFGVAVNKSGDVYVSDGSGSISKFGPTVLVPDVTIEPASNIGTTSATVSGTVNPDGVEVTSCVFEYGVGGKYGHSVACPTAPGSGSSSVPEIVELTSLTPTSEYSVRLSAHNAQGQNVAVESFTTTTPTGPPSVSSVSARELTKVAATLSGSVDPTGLDTTYHFEYGSTTSYGTRIPAADVDVGSSFSSTGVEATPTGLAPGIEYHVRLVASNSAGTTYGQDTVFTTRPAAVVEVEHASAIGSEEVTFEAQIGPLGDATTYHFEYGPTSAYGSSVPVPDGDAGTGSLSESVFEGVQVSQQIGGLQPGMTYHYRVVASNALGAVQGEDRTFRTTSPPMVVPSDGCPNAALRAGALSEGLPDCRAYEMVSPLDKNGSDIGGFGFYATRAAVDGNRASFIASSGFGDTAGSGEVGSVTYIASRSANGWSFHSVTPGSPLTSTQTNLSATFLPGFSSDLRFALTWGVQLTGGAPGTGNGNFYREDLASRGLETATVTSGSPVACMELSCWDNVVAGYASNDVSVIAFQTKERMTAENTVGTTLYAWEHGAVHVAGVLPNGSLPAGGSEGVLGGGGITEPVPVAADESVSNDGSRILFVSPVEGSASQQLYMRKNATSTVWLSRAWISPGVEPEGVKFQAASPDGTKVLFTSHTPLLGSDPNNAEVGLYLYTDTSDNAESETKLSLIARVNGGSVTAMNGDASHIYIANPTPSPGLPERGEYLWDNGTLHHILNTPIVPERPGSGNGFEIPDEVRVSADGRRLAFVRAPDLHTEPELAKPTPGQDVGVKSGIQGYQAMFLYDEGTEKVTCVSCPPNGAPMTEPVYILPEKLLGGLLAPTGKPFAPRWFSSDGRFAFFSSKDALVPQDTNGLADVYEYDADTGQVKLLSPGTGEDGSWFEDASASGSDVFFLTAQKLTGWDTDTLTDLYDVRIDGGLPEPSPPVVPCDGDACQGVPSAVPSFSTASGFVGLGNQSGVVKAKAKKSKPKPRKQRKRKHVKHGRRARRSARHISSRVGR